MCCGQKRETMARQSTAQRIPSPAHATLVPRSFIRLRSLQRDRVAVRGPVSGMLYEFEGAGSVVPADSRDAVALEQTGSFERI
jgi:hypothetical protein